MSDRDDMLRDAINNSHQVEHKYPQTKAELVEYYQDRQDKGEIKSWRQALQNDLARLTGMNPHNIARRFDPSRLNDKERAGTAAQYKELGRTLHPISHDFKGKELVIQIRGQQPGPKGRGTRHRVINVRIPGRDAREFVNDPSFEALWDFYGFDFDEEQGGSYSLDVEAVAA